MADSQQQFRRGQTHGQAKARTENAIDSAKNTANCAADKLSGAAQSTGEAAQRNKDNAAGFFQQTGEQVKNMAQGAVDSVKNTLGVGENNSNNPCSNPGSNTGSNANWK